MRRRVAASAPEELGLMSPSALTAARWTVMAAWSLLTVLSLGLLAFVVTGAAALTNAFFGSGEDWWRMTVPAALQFVLSGFAAYLAGDDPLVPLVELPTETDPTRRAALFDTLRTLVRRLLVVVAAGFVILGAYGWAGLAWSSSALPGWWDVGPAALGVGMALASGYASAIRVAAGKVADLPSSDRH
jgi:hypothetical protein